MRVVLSGQGEATANRTSTWSSPKLPCAFLYTSPPPNNPSSTCANTADKVGRRRHDRLDWKRLVLGDFCVCWFRKGRWMPVRLSSSAKLTALCGNGRQPFSQLSDWNGRHKAYLP